jgi:hypothetical protein
VNKEAKGPSQADLAEDLEKLFDSGVPKLREFSQIYPSFFKIPKVSQKDSPHGEDPEGFDGGEGEEPIIEVKDTPAAVEISVKTSQTYSNLYKELRIEAKNAFVNGFGNLFNLETFKELHASDLLTPPVNRGIDGRVMYRNTPKKTSNAKTTKTADSDGGFKDDQPLSGEDLDRSLENENSEGKTPLLINNTTAYKYVYQELFDQHFEKFFVSINRKKVETT